MGVFLNSGFTGFLSSAKKTINGYLEDFIDGFTGSGWKLWEHKTGKYKLTIDSITVRDSMLIYEMLVSKIRALKGSLVISQANGKIKAVTEDEVNYFIEIEDEMSFVTNDIIRCTTPTKNYWLECSVTDNKIALNKVKLNGVIPEEGDDIVQFGNTTDTARQSLIYLHCDEGGQPTIQLLSSVNSTDLSGCTKVKLDDKGFYTENGEIKNIADDGDIIYHLKKNGEVILAKGNVIMDVDGNITMNNAVMNNAIVTGEVNAETGTLGDLTINGTLQSIDSTGKKIIINPTNSEIRFSKQYNLNKENIHGLFGFTQLNGNDSGYILLSTKDSNGNYIYTTEMYGAYMKVVDKEFGKATEIDANHGLTLWANTTNKGFFINVVNGYYTMYNRSWATAASQVDIGCVYLDGNTLKVRTS